MKITTIGIDLAKTVFQVHGVDTHGKAGLRKQLKRKDMVSFFANLEPCLIGMEACSGAHYWARKLSEFGHTVQLMAPQFVKPYVKTNKSDRNDAEGHPSGKIEAPILHPEINVGVEWRFAFFRAHNAELIVDAATWILWELAHQGKPKESKIQEYLATLRQRLAELLPDGYPTAAVAVSAP